MVLEKVRLIKQDELEKLLLLYRYLNPDDPQLAMNQTLLVHWNEILSDPNLLYFVIEENQQIISSCTLAIIKNLTRSARPYGLIENVVTDPSYRNMGYGTAVLDRAVQAAKEKNCYKVMLMTGRKDENTLNFYEKAGFRKDEKTAFIVRF